MAVSYKSVSVGQQLNSILNVRLAQAAGGALASVLSADSNGYPVLSIGTVSAGNQASTIRVWNYLSQTAEFVDSLGLAAYPYGPMVIQMIVEQISGNTGTLILKALTFAMIWRELVNTGARLELYETAQGTAPSLANIPAAATYVYDNLYYPLTSSS